MTSTNFINECKNRANKNRLGKIIIEDLEQSITNSDKLQSFSIDSGCYVDGNIIGSVYAKCLKASFVSDIANLENKSLQAKVGVKYADLSDEYINMGKYTIERSNNEITANMSQINAYDDVYINLDNKYVCGIDYSNGDKTLKDLYIDVCEQLKLTPKTVEILNGNIPIWGNPFTNGEKNRTVLQTISKISGSFIDIDNDSNEIDLCWLSQNEEPDYIFYKNDYVNVDGGQVVCGPINCLIIKNSIVDDENIVIKDAESIALNGEHAITINEDYILYNFELRKQAINNIWNRIKGMKYVDCKLTTYYGKPFLKLGNKIRIYISDTDYFDTYVLKHQFTYDGTFFSTIESPALTEQEIKNKQDISLGNVLKNTQIEVNKQTQTIKAVVENLEGNKKSISQLKLDTNGLGVEITKTGNNILRGTQLFDFGEWGNQVYLPYVESSIPPDLTMCDTWYCTQDKNQYIGGKIYKYNYSSNEWELTTSTKKELEEQAKLIYGVAINESEYTKDNFYSEKSVLFDPTSPTASLNTNNARLTTKNYNVLSTENKITLSYKLKNEIKTGKFLINLYLYSIYKDFNIHVSEDVIFAYQIEATPDDFTNITLNKHKFDIPTGSNLLNVYMNEAMPIDGAYDYWLKKQDEIIYILYEFKDGNWVLSNEYHNCQDQNGTIYYHFGNSRDHHIYVTYKGNQYIARQLYLDIELKEHYIDIIQEETPVPYKDMYWAKPSTNQIFRAKYNGEEFKEWQVLDTSYQQAIANGTFEGIVGEPFVKPSGTAQIGDIKIEYGDYSDWNANENETTGKNYNFSDKGFTIRNGNIEMYIDEDEIKATNKGEILFSLDGNKMIGNKFSAKELYIQELVTKKYNIGGKKVFARYIESGD